MMLPLPIISYKYRWKFSSDGGMGETVRREAVGQGLKA